MQDQHVLSDSFGVERLLIVPADGSLAAVAAAAALRPPRFPSTLAEIMAERDALLARLAETQGGGASGPVPPVRLREMLLGGVPTLLFEPPSVRGAILHIHGGGWYMGAPSMMVPMLSSWSNELGVIIASLDYRLAPEHRSPAALDDCEYAALAWIELLQDEHPGIRVAIAGESAGAHLASITAIRLRRRHRRRFDSVLLTYGLYDFANALPSREIAESYPGLMNSHSCKHFADLFLSNPQEAWNPDVSPLRLPLSELTDLPPALFIGATLDPFVDDSVLMHNRWLRAGNSAWLALYEEAPHGFDFIPVPHALHVNQLRLEFLRDTLLATA